MSTSVQGKKLSANLEPEETKMLRELSTDKGRKESRVLQEAIRLLYFVTKEREEGRRIWTVDEKGENSKEIVLL